MSFCWFSDFETATLENAEKLRKENEELQEAQRLKAEQVKEEPITEFPCNNCGAMIEVDAKFCGECGADGDEARKVYEENREKERQEKPELGKIFF